MAPTFTFQMLIKISNTPGYHASTFRYPYKYFQVSIQVRETERGFEGNPADRLDPPKKCSFDAIINLHCM